MIEKLTLTCDRLLSHKQLPCCRSYCGIPLGGKKILIYNHVDTDQKPLLLTCHYGDISAMTFGKRSSPVLLCSASADYITVWDIERCQKRSTAGKVAAGTIIGTLLGDIAYLSFCFSDERVAACSGTTVYILNSKRQEVISTLSGHIGPVTSGEFCPWNKDIFVTTSEDRTFKVWNLNTESVCYQSFVLAAYPLLSVVLSEENRHLIAGSADGQVWCFSLSDEHSCHLVTTVDLHKIEKRHQLHLKTVGHQPGGAEDEVEASKPVLKMALYASVIDTNNEQKADCSWLCIGSSDGLYVVDLATSELITALYFKETNMYNKYFMRKNVEAMCQQNLPSNLFNSGYHNKIDIPLKLEQHRHGCSALEEEFVMMFIIDHPNLSITVAGSWSISPGQDNSMVVSLVSSLFAPCVALMEFSLTDLGTISAGEEGLSVFASSPPLLESPLNAEFKKMALHHPKKKGDTKEHPLVFHTKVKSSGYTSSPRRIMFSPKSNVQKNPSAVSTKKNTGFLIRNYPAESAAPSIPQAHLSIAKKPIYCLQYSGDGKQILCGLGDSSLLLYKSSLTGKPNVCTGHDKPVSSVSWSLSRQWWLSGSEDQTVRIWTHGSPEPAIIMREDLFSKPIRNAQFYYLDKFVLLASGQSLYLYLYDVDITRDDIKRYEQRSAVKLAKQFKMTSATGITALSAVNNFYSYIVLVCGSDRSIQIFDMNKATIASELLDAHSRPIHYITQNKGSAFSTQTPESYNLFLTSAVTDGLKIWDLRTVRCVRRYDNHLNRCHPCTSAISACGRFIATGSEDNCAYVYDIRSSSYLHKLQKHSDTVLSVTFNPATPQVLRMMIQLKIDSVMVPTVCLSVDPLGSVPAAFRIMSSSSYHMVAFQLLTGTLDGKLRLFQSSSGERLSRETSAAVCDGPDFNMQLQ